MIDRFDTIWEHSEKEYFETLTRRAENLEEELTCVKQLVEILEEHTEPGMTLLDAGCATGYYYNSLRNLGLEYYGIDSTQQFIDIGKRVLSKAGLHPNRLQCRRIEDIKEDYDIIACYNTLQYLPNYHLPVERLCLSAQKALVIRALFGDKTIYRYEHDEYIAKDYRFLKEYFNIYSISEVLEFIESYGFTVKRVFDKRSLDRDEMVIGKPHPYKILLCQKIN